MNWKFIIGVLIIIFIIFIKLSENSGQSSYGGDSEIERINNYYQNQIELLEKPKMRTGGYYTGSYTEGEAIADYDSAKDEYQMDLDYYYKIVERIDNDRQNAINEYLQRN